MSKKAPNAIDKHVGSRVRMRRMQLRMSQEALGDQLGITFQQVQKNEKGDNRIGASRLQQISKILQVPISFFFEGQLVSPANAEAPPTHMDVLATPDGIAVIAVLAALNPAMRRKYVQLGQLLASDAEEELPTAEVIKLDDTRRRVKPKRRAVG